MLKIQFADQRQSPVWVVEKVFSIGSAQDNNLIVEDPSVSSVHARFHNEGRNFILRDNRSAQGTFVNGQRITQRQVGCGDLIRVGEVDIEIVDPRTDQAYKESTGWSLIADTSWLAGQEFQLLKQCVRVGRSGECDVVIPGTHLSREHAEIQIKDDHITIRDLNSANGSYINDVKVDIGNAKPGDRIRLDVYSFRVFGPGIDMPAGGRPNPMTKGKVNHQEEKEKSEPNNKQWKIPPTSPGNREEDLPDSPNSKMLAIFSGAMFICLIAVATYLFLSH